MGENTTRVLIAEDHTVVRKGLVSLLSTSRFNLEFIAKGLSSQEIATFFILLD